MFLPFQGAMSQVSCTPPDIHRSPVLNSAISSGESWKVLAGSNCVLEIMLGHEQAMRLCRCRPLGPRSALDRGGGWRGGISGTCLSEGGPDPLLSSVTEVRVDLSLPHRSSPLALRPSCCHATSPALLWYVTLPGKGLWSWGSSHHPGPGVLRAWGMQQPDVH